MDLILTTPEMASWNGVSLRCASGENGICPAAVKREGDKKTPMGRWPMREIIYRPDRLPPLITSLPVREMTPADGWCENPESPHYNRLVIGSEASQGIDRLWRDDTLYDLIVVLGYNDRPVVKHKGSAIFLHVARAEYASTAGCVTLAIGDLLKVVAEADQDSMVVVKA